MESLFSLNSLVLIAHIQMQVRRICNPACFQGILLFFHLAAREYVVALIAQANIGAIIT